MEELLRKRLTNINLCINEIITTRRGYEYLDILFTNKTKIEDELQAIEAEKWKRIIGGGVNMEELVKELEKINLDEFMVQMADHLSSDDYRYLDELRTRRREIETKIEKLKEKETQDIFNAMYKICYPDK